MNEWRKRCLESAAVYRARARGCLLGGSLGDALGHPAEFSSLDRIRSAYDGKGVRGLVPGGKAWPAVSATTPG